jgi:predicted PurR-regulated permease PerM
MNALDKSAITRVICATLSLVGLLLAGVAIVRPFIPALLLALIFAVATWPAYAWLAGKMKNRSTLAAVLMTLGLALCLIVPFAVLGSSLADNFAQLNDDIVAALQSDHGAPPKWLARIPFADRVWAHHVNDTTQLTQFLKDNSIRITQWLLNLGAAIGRGLAELALGIFFTFFLLRHGKEGVKDLRILLDRFIGPRAQRLLEVSKTMMTGVVYGLMGTALAQAIIAGIGFWIAGIPGPVFLALLTFMLSPIPIGPPLLWAPAAIWLIARHDIGMGIFMLLWGLLGISMIDNVFRPLLISRGSRMPLLLVFLGAAGGIFTFGFTGLFIGPTVLAVIYVMFLEEVRTQPERGPMAPQRHWR